MRPMFYIIVWLISLTAVLAAVSVIELRRLYIDYAVATAAIVRFSNKDCVYIRGGKGANGGGDGGDGLLCSDGSYGVGGGGGSSR